MYLYSVESKSSICSKLFVVKRPHFSPMFPHEEHFIPSHFMVLIFFHPQLLQPPETSLFF